jgi:hypothetical protein
MVVPTNQRQVLSKDIASIVNIANIAANLGECGKEKGRLMGVIWGRFQVIATGLK